MAEFPGKEALRRMVETECALKAAFDSEGPGPLQQIAAYVAELEAQVAEARELISGLQDMQAMPSDEFDADVRNWLARTAPKEDNNG